MTTTTSEQPFPLRAFLRAFPNDEACLEHLWRLRHAEDGTHARCPRCECHRVFRRYATTQWRKSWTCTGCGHHLHPTAGTVFEGSTTPLRAWFLAMYLLLATDGGISALHLQSELGVNYRTARRIKALLLAHDDA